MRINLGMPWARVSTLGPEKNRKRKEASILLTTNAHYTVIILISSERSSLKVKAWQGAGRLMFSKKRRSRPTGCSRPPPHNPAARSRDRPGTIVWSDMWAAYNNVAQHQSETVNHSIEFVNSATGVHTQHIESYWNRVKTKKSREWRATMTRLSAHTLMNLCGVSIMAGQLQQLCKVYAGISCALRYPVWLSRLHSKILVLLFIVEGLF